MSESSAKEKYRKIIQHLERSYEEKCSNERLEEVFKNSLSREFKLEVTSDSLMEEILKESYQKCYSLFFATEDFGKKLDFFDRINRMLYKIEFISKRDFSRMADTITKEINSPVNLWLGNLPYLKDSADATQFRAEFLIRYCNLQENEVEDILQSDTCQKKMKKHYEGFFTRCLDEGVNPKIINFIEDSFSQFENKSEMLPQMLLKELEKKLGVIIGSDDKQIQINQDLVNIAQNNAFNNDQQAQQRLEDQIKLLERAFRKFSGLNIFKSKSLQLRLGKFGSLTSGFAGLDADLDITILTNSYINELELLRLLHEFLKKEYKNDENSRGSRRISVELIQNAKTPLVAVGINQRGKVDLKIDIIVNNILGIINSKFLCVYSSVRWIKNLGLLVKLWGKNSNLIGKNYLSSYAMILMLIHYLIKVKKAKPILDNRVITNDKPHFEYKRLKQAQIEQFKVYYMFKNQSKDVSIEERANYYKILLGFTEYYGYKLWEEEDERNRIITVDQSIDREVDKECAITIKDPFDRPHNPGRLKADSKDFLIQKFKDAHLILKQGNGDKIKQLFGN